MLFAMDVLGGNVGGRAEQLPGIGHRVVVEQPRDPKVTQDQATVGAEHDVFGLDVAVDDSKVVGGGQGVGQGPADERDDLGRQGAMQIKKPAQRRTADELGDKVAVLGLILATGVDLQDVLVVEPSDGPRLTGKALPRLRFARQVRVHHLDRDLTIKLLVVGTEDGSHPPMPDKLKQSIVREGAPDHRERQPTT